ncbi:MAG: 4-hydroxy-tetrahydrodipicolinate synthase [Deltaproteobacteria bacterium]|nr:4-hydroxy-tetrahydrodipicolinate synthase [Deltaproteobacteria bacterium]
MTTFQGTYTALVTPFRRGEVDEEALRDLVERQIAAGIDGLVPCGTTGENVTLSDEEHGRVVKVVVEAAKGRVPVVAGAGSNSTTKTVAHAKACREAGADGLLLVCPYYNKPTQAGVEAHFRAVLSKVPMPAMLYNIPGRTHVDLTAETLVRLMDVEHIVAVKEATGNIVRTQQIAALCGDRYSILSGDDALTVGLMAVGGSGVVSVLSNAFPAEVADVARRMAAGDLAGARALQHRLLPVYEAMFIEPNPGPVKFVMAEAGKIAPEIRLPMTWPTEGAQGRIRAAVEMAGLAS